jgi:hypothetical protein
MEANDTDLEKFEAEGARPLPVEGEHTYVENDGRGSGTSLTAPVRL